MLAIGRGLMQEPKVLMIDELSSVWLRWRLSNCF